MKYLTLFICTYVTFFWFCDEDLNFFKTIPVVYLFYLIFKIFKLFHVYLLRCIYFVVILYKQKLYNTIVQILSHTNKKLQSILRFIKHLLTNKNNFINRLKRSEIECRRCT